MDIYFYILFLLIILWSLSHIPSLKKIPFLSFGIILIIIIASCKSTLVGTDSYSYYDFFEDVESYKNHRIYTGIQRFWYYFNYFLKSQSDYSVFLFTCYTIAYGGVGWLIYKLSPDKLLSLIIFYLFFFPGSLNIMRQYIGVGCFCLGLVFLSQKEYIKYVISLIIGSFFHYSVILMIPLIWIDYYNVKPKINILIVAVTFFIGFFMDIVRPIISAASIFTGLNQGSSIYLDQWGTGVRNIATNAIINAVFILSYLISQNKNDKSLKLWYFFIVFSNLFGAAGDRKSVV